MIFIQLFLKNRGCSMCRYTFFKVKSKREKKIYSLCYASQQGLSDLVDVNVVNLI